MKRLLILVLFSLLLIGAAAHAQDDEAELTATITNAAGEEIGTVAFFTLDENAMMMGSSSPSLAGMVGILVQVEGLTPGFHGFHIHSVGSCDASGERPFASAEGHLHAEGEVHGQHMGDLPSLLTSDSGVAVLATATDRFTLEDLMDEDGSAVIIHAGADNFGNIPADRYDPDADETTLNTGDAGGRFACGVITAGSP
jgi:Cu-Zn family superoxide dismutase